MHSALTRAQAVFGFFTSVAIFVAGLAALSVLLFPTDAAKANVELKNVQVIKGRPHYYSSRKEDFAQFKFDLDADLSPLFNWNTKQLFVYVYAAYSSSPNSNANVPQSESIIWDTIISAPESPYSMSALKQRYFPGKPKKLGLVKNKNKDKQKKGKKGQSADDKPGVLHLRDQKQKYQIADITGKMAERTNVTLAVGWNVQPWVGALWWSPATGAVPRTGGDEGRTKPFDFPALKGSKPSTDAV